MKNSTKILSVLLSLIIALSVFTAVPVGVSAAEAKAAPVGAVRTVASTGYDPTEAPTEEPTCGHWDTYTENENYQYYDDGCSYDLVTYCSYCNEEISRERINECYHYDTYTVTENYKNYGDHGSYDLITYCNICGQEVSREHKEVTYPTGDGVIYFDAASAGWYNPSSVLFYIYEITENGSEELAPWGSKKYLGGVNIGNGIWAFDAKGLGVTEGHTYAVIFNNYDTIAQTHDLLLDTSCFGDTAYANPDTNIETVYDSNKRSMEARWRNNSLGPMLMITSTGNVVGETIPANTTAYQMFVNFLASSGYQSLRNALSYNGKDVQTAIDDTASALGLSRVDVSRAITEAKDVGDKWGDRYDWSYEWRYERSTLPLPAPVDIPDEDGLILFDARSAGWEDANAVMFDIFDLNDQRLPARSTPDEIRGTKSYDGIWFFNAQKRGVQDGQLYYIIFWNDDTGERTGSLLLDSTCFGDKASCDGSVTPEIYVSYPSYRHSYNSSSSGSSASSSGYNVSSYTATPYLPYSDYYESYPTVSWTDPHSFSLSGTTGDLTWTVANGVLTISGSGPLESDDNRKKLWNRLGFTDLVIENGVTSIGDGVFDGCYSLETVTLGKSVKSIGSRAFKDCKNLESFSTGSSVTSIGQFAFYRCVGLKTATLGNSVIKLGSSAFYSCSSLETVTLGNSLTKIDKCTFEECTALKTVNLGNSVYGIALGAFYGCESLQSITLPDSVQIIADSAFRNCTGLASVSLGNSVTDIGERAFYNCPNLKSVELPASASNIDTKAFGYYYNDEYGITLKVPGFTINGDVGSEAQRYAKTFGFGFERAIAVTGDADGDCMVTIMDVTEVQHSLSMMNTKTDEDLKKYADVDKNNLLEIIDATWIQRNITGIDTPYDAAIGQIISNG
ncbi:MAG: leucine-rich repeat protein [Ruminococcus sp.]|nr:leucine-rich repeat protein [Ruminococcus sp.]